MADCVHEPPLVSTLQRNITRSPHDPNHHDFQWSHTPLRCHPHLGPKPKVSKKVFGMCFMKSWHRASKARMCLPVMEAERVAWRAAEGSNSRSSSLASSWTGSATGLGCKTETLSLLWRFSDLPPKPPPHLSRRRGKRGAHLHFVRFQWVFHDTVPWKQKPRNRIQNNWQKCQKVQIFRSGEVPKLDFCFFWGEQAVEPWKEIRHAVL